MSSQSDQKHAAPKSGAGQDVKSDEVHDKVVASIEAVGGDEQRMALASGPASNFLLPAWGPVVMELLNKFGLEAATTSLPKLRELVQDQWKPTGPFWKFIQRQLISAIDSVSNELPLRNTSLADFEFHAAPKMLAK